MSSFRGKMMWLSRRLRRRRYVMSALSALVALVGVAVLAGAAYAGDDSWDEDIEYGDGQVAPGTGGDWRPMQTCWRVVNEHHRVANQGSPIYGVDYDWPFCHEIEVDPSLDPANAGNPKCVIDPDRSFSDYMLFGIFLGDYERILRQSGANLITMRNPFEEPLPSNLDPYHIYSRDFGEPSAAPRINRFVPRERPGDASLPNLPDGDGINNSHDGDSYNHTRVYQSREQYLRDLYYSRSNPDGGTLDAWYMDKNKFEMVPAREAPRFFVRWQHPDHPMGGLMTDYAYVLQQQNYLNAQLLGNVRSYNADGNRVIYKVQSKEAVLLHGQQVGNCGTPAGTAHQHPATCTLTGTITSHRVVYPSTIALSYDYNPAPPRFGPTPTPFITRAPPQQDHRVDVPERGSYEWGLRGTPYAPNLTPIFQHRQAFDAGLPRPVGTLAPTAPPGFAGEQVHIPEYTYYDVSRVGTYDYPYYGIWGIPWEDWGVDYHKRLLDTSSDLYVWASANLTEPYWNRQNSGSGYQFPVAGQEWPNDPTPTVAWHLQTITPIPNYKHATDSDPFTVGGELHSYAEGERYFESHNQRNPYPTPDQLIFSDGPARQVENPFVIRDYPNTSLDAISIEMEMPAIYREDVLVNYSETADLLEVPVPVSRYGGEYASPLFTWNYSSVSEPTAARSDAIAGYQQFFVPLEKYAKACNPYTVGCAHLPFTRSGESLRPGPYDFRGSNLANEYPHDSGSVNYVEETYRFKWPVFFDDVSWYLFELHGVNKALADSNKFAEAVLDHNPFSGSADYPAWALDPRMVGRPYDGIGQPYADGGPLELDQDRPEIPHRYYGGGLLNYRNTVDPLEHKNAVKHMATIVPMMGDSWSQQATHALPGRLPPLGPTAPPGYGMYTNRKVFFGAEYAGFDGDNASYDENDFAVDTYGKSRNHNLTFLPLKPAVNASLTAGFEPGGTLVKRGVSSPMADGSNSRFDWIVHDSSPIQVHGGHSLSTYQALGMPMPGSFLFGSTQYRWPDYPLDPNRTYLMATMYYEASFLSPFYIVKDPTGGSVEPDAIGRGVEIVGRVPRMVMRPVFCRVLIQPLGVNEGPGLWRKAAGGLKSALTNADDFMTGGAITRTITKVNEKISGSIQKVKDFVEKLNPIAWFSGLLSKGAQGLAEKSTTAVCSGGQMADRVAGSSGGDASETEDLDHPNSSGNRRSKNEAIDRCREVSAAQEAEAKSCPEGSDDDGVCGIIPDLELQVSYNRMEPVEVSLDNDEEFGVRRGFYERPHFVDGDRQAMNLVPPKILPGPLQFGYYTPGVNVPLPQRGDVGVDLGHYSGSQLAQPGSMPTTRCPTEWELGYMKAVGDPWEEAVQAQVTSSTSAVFPSAAREWDSYPVGVSEVKLDENDVRRAYNDGFCAPMFVAVGCDAKPGGQCPGMTVRSPWAQNTSGVARVPLVSLPIEWRTAELTSSSAQANYFDISITSNGSDYGPVYFNSNTTGVPVVGGSPFNSSQYLMSVTTDRTQEYRVPAYWRERKDVNEFEYVRVPYSGFIFGSLQGTPVSSRHTGFGDYAEMCGEDLPTVSSCVGKSSYFTNLNDVPGDVGDFGLDPYGLQDPIRDYDALVHDLTTVYAMGPGASYGLKIRAVMLEDTGVTNRGNWSDTLTLNAATLCPFLDPGPDDPGLQDRYEKLSAGLGCDASNEVFGAETLSFASVAQQTPSGVDWVWRMAGTDVCTGFFDSTPARLTWAVDGVVRGWGMVWVISMAALVFLIFWQGIRMTYDMWMHGGWANQRDPGFREAVPRFFIALILAAFSLMLCRLVLILVSNISCYVAKSSEVGIWTVLLGFLILAVAAIAMVVGKALLVAGVSGGLLAPAMLAVVVAVLGLIIMVVGFFMMMFGRVMLQLLIRLAMLAVLITLSPLAFILMASPDTEDWTKKWIGMFVTMSVTQTLQLLTLYLSAKVFNFGSVVGSGGVPMWTGLVMGIVILYLVSKIPEILDRYLGQAIVSGGSAPGMIPGAIGGASKGLESSSGGNPSVGEQLRQTLPGRLGRVNNPSSGGSPGS